MKSRKEYITIAVVAFVTSIVISACNNTNTTTTKIAETSPSPATSPEMAGMKHVGGKKININSAILSELDKLEAKLGVPALSNKIQAERPYKTPEDLVAKKVIDQKQFDRIKDLVTIEDILITGVEKDADYMVKLGLMK